MNLATMGKLGFARFFASPRATAETAWPDDPPRKILIVDDDPIILETTSLKLKLRGYEVVTARDGSEAIGAMRDERPDLVLLDLSFPPDVAQGGRFTFDGFQIMDRLRGLKEADHVPFVVITGGDPAEYQKRSLASGALAFFHKPIDHKDLLPLIKRTIG